MRDPVSEVRVTLLLFHSGKAGVGCCFAWSRENGNVHDHYLSGSAFAGRTVYRPVPVAELSRRRLALMADRMGTLVASVGVLLFSLPLR